MKKVLNKLFGLSQDKDTISMVFEAMGYDEESTVVEEGHSSRTLQSNPYFRKGVAELYCDLTFTEDKITNDLSVSAQQKEDARLYLSQCRIALGSMENMLDAKISLMENALPEDDTEEDDSVQT